MASKICNRCNEEKELADFGKHSRKKDGLRADCRSCVSDQNRIYKAANAEKMREYAAAYRERTRAQRAKDKRAWYLANREHSLAYAQNYVKRRLAEDPDYIIRRSRAWMEKNREKTRLRAHNRRRAKYRANSFHVTARDLEKLRRQDCIYCGSRVNIQIDHVIPLARGGGHGIGNLAPACAKCNHSKTSKFVMEWKRDLKKRVEQNGAY